MNEITLRKIVFHFLTWLVLSGLALCVNVSVAQTITEKKPLAADQAFAFSVSFISAHQIKVQWQMAPGYYLYRDKTHLRFDPGLSASVHYPQGIAQQDALRGSYQIYTGHLRIPVSFAVAYKQIQMYIDYQGCSAQGFCYPPIKKKVMLNLQQQTLSSISLQDTRTPLPAISLYTLLKDQNGVHALLDSHKLSVQLLIFICLGLLLTFTPCVLPMIPILTSIIVGQEKNRGTQKAFLLSLCYVIGMALTYALAGLVAASLGSSIQVWLQKPIFILLVSLLFILLAFSLFDLYELRLPRRWHHQLMHWSNQHQGGTFIGVFFMGVLSTLIVSPCVTAPLIGVLIYISHTGDKILGAFTLFAMGIGMGIPLLLIGMSAGHWLPKSGRWLEVVKKFFGLMMIGMAIWLSARVFSPIILYLLTGLFILGMAVFFGVYLPRLIGWHRVNRSIGLVFALVGLGFIISSAISTFFVSHAVISATSKRAHSFIVVRNIEELDQQLSRAKLLQRPVLLDFYADWCESCVVMEKKIFSLPETQQMLHHFVLLRADLSANSAADEVLLKHFKVIAPPTVLFFNRQGKEVDSRRIIGEVDKEEFLSRLNIFITANCDKSMTC